MQRDLEEGLRRKDGGGRVESVGGKMGRSSVEGDADGLVSKG